MTNADEVAQAVAKLSPDELARFRAWFREFEATRPDTKPDLETTATKLGRFAGRAIAEFRKRNPPKT
jgi:hypothetical protein